MIRIRTDDNEINDDFELNYDDEFGDKIDQINDDLLIRLAVRHQGW